MCVYLCIYVHIYVHNIIILKIERWTSTLYFPREETVKIKPLNKNERHKENLFKILETVNEI